MEIHTDEPLVHEPGPFDVEIATEHLKSYEVPGMVQIVAELIQAGSETLYSEHSSEIIYNSLSSGRSLVLYLSTTRMIQMTYNYQAYHCY
jgi:hypothetical protein